MTETTQENTNPTPESFAALFEASADQTDKLAFADRKAHAIDGLSDAGFGEKVGL